MPPAPPRVSVVIPNWNGLAHLPECLAALAAQSFTAFETVVVDNGSSDGSAAWVREHHPTVRLLERSDNGGFAKAVNTGILASQSEYVALLNNDTAVDPDWLGALVRALDEHCAYDFAASKMVFYSEPERLNAAGDIWARGRMAGENRGFGQPSSRYDTMERVFGACAGAALYRRALFDAVGLFDEDFFLMHEDTDFNLRSLIAARRCLYVPAALVRHKCGASIEIEPDPEITRLRTRNEALVAAKDLPARTLLWRTIVWPYRFLRQTFPARPSNWRRVPMLLRRSPQRIRAEVEGFRMGLAKRRAVWRLRAIETREIRCWLRNGSGPA